MKPQTASELAYEYDARREFLIVQFLDAINQFPEDFYLSESIEYELERVVILRDMYASISSKGLTNGNN